MRRCLALIVLALVLLTAAPARAEGPPVPAVDFVGTYFKVGLGLGGAFARERSAGFVIGPLIELIRLPDNDAMFWYGAQADLMVDSNGDADTGARWSIGPTFGKFVVGADLEYLGERVGGETYHGLGGRLKLTVGIAALYFRYGHTFDSPDADFAEVGLQLKLPIRLGKPRVYER